jgi:hypothetical protein
MSDNNRKLYGYAWLREGMEIVSIDTIPTETQIMADKYLCMVVEHNGDEMRMMIPVASIVQARPYTSEMLKMCSDGNDFFNIQEIAARDRGDPFVMELDHSKPTKRIECDETDNTV